MIVKTKDVKDFLKVAMILVDKRAVLEDLRYGQVESTSNGISIRVRDVHNELVYTLSTEQSSNETFWVNLVELSSLLKSIKTDTVSLTEDNLTAGSLSHRLTPLKEIPTLPQKKFKKEGQCTIRDAKVFRAVNFKISERYTDKEIYQGVHVNINDHIADIVRTDGYILSWITVQATSDEAMSFTLHKKAVSLLNIATGPVNIQISRDPNTEALLSTNKWTLRSICYSNKFPDYKSLVKNYPETLTVIEFDKADFQTLHNLKSEVATFTITKNFISVSTSTANLKPVGKIIVSPKTTQKIFLHTQALTTLVSTVMDKPIRLSIPTDPKSPILLQRAGSTWWKGLLMQAKNNTSTSNI